MQNSGYLQIFEAFFVVIFLYEFGDIVKSKDLVLILTACNLGCPFTLLCSSLSGCPLWL